MPFPPIVLTPGFVGFVIEKPARSVRRYTMLVCGWVVLASLLAGCRTWAPIHVWQPPVIASVEGKSIVMMGIDGPAETADAIGEELLAQTSRLAKSGARDSSLGRLQFMRPSDLHSNPTIRLVSGTDAGFADNLEVTSESSDLTIAAAAREKGVNQLLRGEVLFATGHEDSDERLSVVWRLIGLDPSATTAGLPVSVDQEFIAWRYPDLMSVTDPHERLRKAIVRRTVSELTVSVDRQRIDLAKPRFRLGSSAVRRGNDLAMAGHWPEAEQVWEETLERYPGQAAAWINAAIAAAARQDFTEAKRRASRAVQISVFAPIHRTLAQETLVWIELRQREYHEAFGLPDPPEGWRVTSR
ncbi:hypothetical protein [Neorhodopirellula lusitana]|nr:hypothetical protein [Neorhodopirellula lusitana]